MVDLVSGTYAMFFLHASVALWPLGLHFIHFFKNTYLLEFHSMAPSLSIRDISLLSSSRALVVNSSAYIDDVVAIEDTAKLSVSTNRRSRWEDCGAGDDDWRLSVVVPVTQGRADVMEEQRYFKGQKTDRIDDAAVGMCAHRGRSFVDVCCCFYGSFK